MTDHKPTTPDASEPEERRGPGRPRLGRQKALIIPDHILDEAERLVEEHGGKSSEYLRDWLEQGYDAYVTKTGTQGD